MTKDKRITIRLPEDLFSEISSRAEKENCSVATIIRECVSAQISNKNLLEISREKAKKTAEDSSKKEIKTELKYMGNNINQMAKALNSLAQCPAGKNVVAILERMEKGQGMIESHLRDIKDRINNE